MGVNSLPWYYAPDLAKTRDIIPLTGDEWHHCYKVLRLKSGDSIILTDGRGGCMEGRLASVNAREGMIELIQDLRSVFQKKRSYQITIAMAPTKNIDRTEFAVEKMTELGVDEICFLDCRHGERSKLRMDRMEKIVISAAKQSRKISFPVLSDLMSPGQFIQRKKNGSPGISMLCCHLDETSNALSENYSPQSNVVLLIGPEGGFSVDELSMMQQYEVKMTHLGPYRLRVETAAIAACAMVHQLNEMNIKS